MLNTAERVLLKIIDIIQGYIVKKHTQQKKSFDKQKVIILSSLLGVALIVLATVIVVKAIGKKDADITTESIVGSQIDVVYGVNGEPVAVVPEAGDLANPTVPAASVPGATGDNTGTSTTSDTGTTPNSGATPTNGDPSAETATPTAPVGATATPTPVPASSSGGTGYVDSSGFIVDAPSGSNDPAPVIAPVTDPAADTNSTTPEDDGLVVFPLIPASDL